MVEVRFLSFGTDFPGLAPTNKYRKREKPAEGKPVITREIVKEIRKELEKIHGVHSVQAPGEADPQLAFMALNGIIDAVVTEDSDLIVYGCETILHKLKPTGKCMVYEKSKLELEFDDFRLLRWVSILTGCDYVPGGFPKIGLKRATALVKKFGPFEKYNEEEIRRLLTRIDGTFL